MKLTGSNLLYIYISLTPADKWHSNNESGSDMTKYDDQLLEHEHRLCPHPHHSHQCEVVDQNWHKHTAFVRMCLVNTTHKDDQHAKQSYTELDVKLGSISLTEFPVQWKCL